MRVIAAIALALLLPLPALADPIPGPITAHVVSVYDGDTITVAAVPWPGVTIRVGVRVEGIDTPEIRGACEAEKDLAFRARDRVRELVGATVELRNIRHGKCPINRDRRFVGITGYSKL
jgi:endonuclease YncB( thermonuclease family)